MTEVKGRYIVCVSPPGMATLYVSPHPDDFRSLLALIAAEACPSASVQSIAEDPPASLNARSRPALVLGAGDGDSVLSGASAVAWYLASLGKKAGADAKQQSQVWQWLSFADNELTPVSCAVVFPLMGVMQLDKVSRGDFFRAVPVAFHLRMMLSFLSSTVVLVQSCCVS